jgi:hypothetical protein
MSKKIIVKEAALGKFLQSFFIAKANGKDNEFINKLDKVSPKVAAMWDDLNNTINSDIAKQYRYLKSKGFDTSALDDYIKSNNITV